MFLIYSGYITPDNYDSEYPRYDISLVDDEEGVKDFIKDFKEELHDECDSVILRVFEVGREMKIKEKEKVTEWIIE